jgi:hypothetical protein
MLPVGVLHVRDVSYTIFRTPIIIIALVTPEVCPTTNSSLADSDGPTWKICR